MTDYAALYGRLPAEPEVAWLAARAASAAIMPNAQRGRVVLQWGETSLVVSGPSDADHRDTALATIRKDCELGSGMVKDVLRALDDANGIFFLIAEPELDGEPLAFVRRVQAELGALLVSGDEVLDATGRVLVTLPPEEDEHDVPPPDALRVRRRAQILAAVAARASMEQALPEHGQLAPLWDWLDRHSLWDEAEPAERDLLRTDRGKLTERQVVDGSWRSEGLAVLAWALGVYELPAHDIQADPKAVTDAVGLFLDVLPPRVFRPALRSDEDLDWMHGRLLGLHWRLRDFSLRPTGMDFTRFAASCWFGSFDLTGIAVVELDLAIAGAPIARADVRSVRACSSIAVERHHAINWLRGYAREYSDVDTST